MTLEQRILNIAEKTAEWQDFSVELLNDVFTPLSYLDRIRLLYKYFNEKDVLLTSSFGTSSAFLLWAFSEMRPSQQHSFHRYDLSFSRNHCLQSAAHGPFQAQRGGTYCPTPCRTPSPPRSNGGRSTPGCAARSTKWCRSTPSRRPTRSGFRG
jgi:hypothetical protein